VVTSLGADFDELSSWAGMLSGVTRGRAATSLRKPVKKSGGGTGAFLGIASDGRQYWIKVPDNPQGTQVLVNEVVVAAIGRLLDAPLRPTVLITIPDSLSEWRVVPGMALRQGVAHGSEHLDQSEENDSLEYRGRDDNRARQASLVALWDLCMGGDPQWLFDLANEYSIWSFDHGLWLGGDGYWTRASLERSCDLAWPWEESLGGLDRRVFRNFADRISALSAQEVLSAIGEVPVEWGVPDSELEALAWFLYYRRTAAAERLQALSEQN
jgi:hypothetical protein